MALKPAKTGTGSNAGDKVAEQVVLQALNLERLKADEVKRVLSLLEDLSKDLAEKIAEADPTGVGPSTYRQRRMAALFASINQTIKETYRQLNKSTGNFVKSVVSAEAKAAALSLNKGAYGGVMLAGLPTTAQLQAIASDVLVLGSPSKEWWGQQAGDLENRFKTQIRQGMVLGEGVDQLTARIRGTRANDFKDGIMALPKHRAEALVRSSVQSASNAARLGTLQANADLLNGYQWLATLDGRTSDLCKARSGLRWDIDFEPVGHDKTWSAPPAHWNCRSTIIPWLKSYAELGKTGKVLKRTKGEKLDSYFQKALTAMGVRDASKILRNTQASLDGQVAGDLNYERWLKSKSPRFQKEVLGEARYNLLQEGKISLLDLVDQSSNPITLAQLEALVDQGKVSLVKFDKAARKDAIEAAKAKAKQSKVIELTEDEALAWLATWPKEKKFNQNAYDNAKKKNPEWENMTGQQRKTLVMATFDDMQQKYWQSAAANKIKNGKKLGKKEQKFWDSADPDYKDAVLAKFAKQKADQESLEEALALDDALEMFKDHATNTVKIATDLATPSPALFFAVKNLLFSGMEQQFKSIAAVVKATDPEKYAKSVKQGTLDVPVISRFNKNLNAEVDINAAILKVAAKDTDVDVNKAFVGFMNEKAGSTIQDFAEYIDKFSATSAVALKKAKDDFANKFNEVVDKNLSIETNALKGFLFKKEAALTLKQYLDEVEKVADIPAKPSALLNIAYKAHNDQFDSVQKVIKTEKKALELDPDASLLTTEQLEAKILLDLDDELKGFPNLSASVSISNFAEEASEKLIVATDKAAKAQTKAEAAVAEIKSDAVAMRKAIDEGAAKYKAQVEVIQDFSDEQLKFMDGTKKELAEAIVKPYTIEQTPTMLDFDMSLNDIKVDFFDMTDDLIKDFNKVKSAVALANPEFVSMAEVKEAALALVLKTAKALKKDTGVSQAPFKIFSQAEAQAFKGGLAKAAKQQKDLAEARAQGLLFDDFEQIGPQGGSNVGALYQSKINGQKFYIKAPDSEVQAKVEILSSKLYQMAGVRAADVSPIRLKGTIGRTDVDGRLGVASKIEDIEDLSDEGIAALVDVQDGFAADAWLANWDVIGNGGPKALNIKKLADGSAFRIDTGATLQFRAQGGLKAFPADKVDELESLKATDSAQRLVFGDIGEAKIVQGVARIAAINDDDIRRVVKEIMGDDAGDLAETLIGRKNFLATKYKKELAALNKKAKPKPVKGLEVPESEYSKVIDGRGNGYSQLRDKDQIEDQEVLMWNYKNADGSLGGGLSFKVRDKLSEKLSKIFQEAGGKDSFVPPRFDSLDDRIERILRSIGARARDSRPLKATHIEEYNNIVEEFGRIKNQLADAVFDERYDESVLLDFSSHYRLWMKDIETAVYNNDTVSAVIFKPHTDEFFKAGGFSLPRAKAKKVAESKWVRERIPYTKSEIDRGFLKYTSADDRSNINMARSLEIEFEAAVLRENGIEIRYFSNAQEEVAFRDLVDVRFLDPSPEKYEEALKTLKKAGIDLTKADEIDIELAYLERYFYLFDTKKDGFIASVEAGYARKARKLAEGKSAKEKLEIYREQARLIIQDRTGQKIDNLLDFPDYKPLGRTEYWGSGRRLFDRPDLSGDQWEQFAEEYVLRHELTAGGGDVVENFKNILNGGGVLAPTTEKARRGIKISGMSPDSDLRSGGASYVFTRLERRSYANTMRGSIVWRPNLIKRLDAITYDHDAYGRMLEGGRNYVTMERYTSIEGFKFASANDPRNETIFKNSLSIFEDVLQINVFNQDQKDRLIKVFEDAKVYEWPDGRSLDEVIVVTG